MRDDIERIVCAGCVCAQVGDVQRTALGECATHLQFVVLGAGHEAVNVEIDISGCAIHQIAGDAHQTDANSTGRDGAIVGERAGAQVEPAVAG